MNKRESVRKVIGILQDMPELHNQSSWIRGNVVNDSGQTALDGLIFDWNAPIAPVFESNVRTCTGGSACVAGWLAYIEGVSLNTILEDRYPELIFLFWSDSMSTKSVIAELEYYLDNWNEEWHSWRHNQEEN